MTRTMDNQPRYYIRPARTKEDIDAVWQLFKTYADGLGIDLSYQSFAQELSGLPGRYAPPYGELFLARATDDDAVLGCAAFRPFDDLKQEQHPERISGAETPKPRARRCEMKRLYVCPEARGTGLGEALARAILEKAAELGYCEALLDTLPIMVSAVRLYEKLGFVEIPHYYETPVPGTKFYSLQLKIDGNER